MWIWMNLDGKQKNERSSRIDGLSVPRISKSTVSLFGLLILSSSTTRVSSSAVDRTGLPAKIYGSCQGVKSSSPAAFASPKLGNQPRLNGPFPHFRHMGVSINGGAQK